MNPPRIIFRDPLEKTEAFLKAVTNDFSNLENPPNAEREQQSKIAYSEFIQEQRRNVHALINGEKQIVQLRNQVRFLEERLNSEVASQLAAQVEIENLKNESETLKSILNKAEKDRVEALADKETLMNLTHSLKSENEALKRELEKLQRKTA